MQKKNECGGQSPLSREQFRSGAAPHFLLGLCSRYIVFALVAVFSRSLNNFSFIARTPLVSIAQPHAKQFDALEHHRKCRITSCHRRRGPKFKEINAPEAKYPPGPITDRLIHRKFE